MKNTLNAIILLTSAFLLTACMQGKVASDEEGKKLAEDYLTLISKGDYETAFTYVSEDFFKLRPREGWIAYYDAVKKEMGPITSIKLLQKLVDDRFSGRFYIYQFYLEHKNGPTKEMITMIQKINSDEPLHIFAHKIESKKLAEINSRY